MRHVEFLSGIRHEEVMAAIAAAESRTSGEIRVWVSHREVADALQAARERFDKLGMHKTTHRNAVLLYFAPRSRVFAVVGDAAVHDQCGDAFWQEVAGQLAADLKKTSFTGALVRAVQKIGVLLAEHFPTGPGDKNELPDDIVGDP